MNYANVIYKSQAMSMFASEKEVADFYALSEPAMGWHKVFNVDDLRHAQVVEVVKNGYKSVFVTI